MTTIAVAVVLAGGASRRFGADKLAAAVDGTTLLDRALSGLAADRTVIVVGPARPVDRTVGFIPDDHPSGGPAAALVTGLRAAVDLAADLIMVLPGDAPAGGAAAELLATRLAEDPAGPGVVGVTADGREQPLQLALRRPAAERVLAAAGSDGAAGRSARRLIAPLGLRRVELDPAAAWDIDTPEQRLAWAWRDSPAAGAVRAAIAAHSPRSVILVGPSAADVAALARAVLLAGAGLALGATEHRAGGAAAEVLVAGAAATAPTLTVGLGAPGPELGPVDLVVPVPPAPGR
ncbi:MAG TPA: NTP transferase domain-containing protein [Microlunatus sp.]|nr:NTP transferase domain-containing protein [Microlunatus sp.]